jgi:hypothetical protein
LLGGLRKRNPKRQAMQENEQARALSIHADSHIPFPLDTNPGHEVN